MEITKEISLFQISISPFSTLKIASSACVSLKDSESLFPIGFFLSGPVVDGIGSEDNTKTFHEQREASIQAKIDRQWPGGRPGGTP